jgi:hypothetical protein
MRTEGNWAGGLQTLPHWNSRISGKRKRKIYRRKTDYWTGGWQMLPRGRQNTGLEYGRRQNIRRHNWQ